MVNSLIKDLLVYFVFQLRRGNKINKTHLGSSLPSPLFFSFFLTLNHTYTFKSNFTSPSNFIPFSSTNSIKMDIEERQAELIEQFVEQVSAIKGSSLIPIIMDATSNPYLFAFSEILAVPNVAELVGTEHSIYLNLLSLFAHGTWNDYKNNTGSLPALTTDQILKLKQLTILTLAKTSKVLPYDHLMQELDVTNVRELEDFLINECMYAGIVRGKLDQLRRCFEVQFAAGRDLRPGQLGNMIQTLTNWLGTSDNLLLTIEEKIKWADSMSEVDKKHKKEVEERLEEVKKTISHKADVDFRGHEEICSEPGGVMDFEEDRIRPKRRRHPLH